MAKRVSDEELERLESAFERLFHAPYVVDDAAKDLSDYAIMSKEAAPGYKNKQFLATVYHPEIAFTLAHLLSVALEILADLRDARKENERLRAVVDAARQVRKSSEFDAMLAGLTQLYYALDTLTGDSHE